MLYSWNDTTYIKFNNKEANTKTILLAMPFIKPIEKATVGHIDLRIRMLID